jgi:hypothetical protein
MGKYNAGTGTMPDPAQGYSILKSWYAIWGTLTQVMVSARNANPGHGSLKPIVPRSNVNDTKTEVQTFRYRS